MGSANSSFAGMYVFVFVFINSSYCSDNPCVMIMS